MRCYCIPLISLMLSLACESAERNLRDNKSLATGVYNDNQMFSRERRGLQHRPYYYWFDEEELLETKNGVIPTLSCPIGTYRDLGNQHLRRPGGIRLEGCIACPKGRYGTTTDLSSELCTAPCSRGTYLDRKGGSSQKDCIRCPVGTFGEEEGLTKAKCSGLCTDLNTSTTKYYSIDQGLVSRSQCKVCPNGYRGGQCKWDFTDGGEHTHHYEFHPYQVVHDQRAHHGDAKAEYGKVKLMLNDFNWN
mmetsp:Transcript_51911/g.60682  ORF Transcript_51911/g.60682 Transcript_51911/m.60682 type:complete len:247 (-) Transcript_51911:191-931(-)|eukprot:CAMPEP_0194381112 /NCGR_PEP_ID=MMETSP0174-20130528/50277_1 /TAXON_ID=216777 /ORGANISM="Proboscia alata, Strain PI-D3" /LENGTH=246 /DNA_ID=CAMNT_0039165121 /DNA_START=108 /DNA_END=848 /DNA_ORIENTATION=+